MGLSCGAKFFKYCLFAFNLIFFIAGLVCLGIGIWLIITKGEAMTDIYDALANIKDIAPEDKVENDMAFRDLGILLTVAGAIVLLIAFLGCCGAVKEWRPLLIAYAVFLLLVLAILFSAAIYAGVNKSSMNEKIKKAMEKSLKYYEKSEGVKEAWNNLMKDWACCGVNSDSAIDDFGSVMSMQNTTYLPASCCPTDKKQGNTCPEEHAYKTGCYESLKDWFSGKIALVIGVGVAVAVFLLVGIVFALCLCQAISKDEGAYA